MGSSTSITDKMGNMLLEQFCLYHPKPKMENVATSIQKVCFLYILLGFFFYYFFSGRNPNHFNCFSNQVFLNYDSMRYHETTLLLNCSVVLIGLFKMEMKCEVIDQGKWQRSTMFAKYLIHSNHVLLPFPAIQLASTRRTIWDVRSSIFKLSILTSFL